MSGTGAWRPWLVRGAGGAWLVGGAPGAVYAQSLWASAGAVRLSGVGPGVTSYVRPLRLQRAAVRLGLGLRPSRAADCSAGPRTLRARVEAGVAEQPMLRGCAVRIGCAFAIWGDAAAAGNRDAICTRTHPH